MKILFFFLLLLAFASCTKNQNEEGVAMNVDLMELPAPAQGGSTDEIVEVDKSVVSRKLIKEGLVQFETSDIEKTEVRSWLLLLRIMLMSPPINKITWQIRSAMN